MTDVLIGVDGGGTRTRVLLVDFDGNTIARGDGAATLVDPDRPEDAALLLDAIVRRAIDDAGVARPGAAMWAGLAGAGRESTRRTIPSMRCVCVGPRTVRVASGSSSGPIRPARIASSMSWFR